MSTHDTTHLSPSQRRLSIGAVILSTVGVGISYGIGYPITALTFDQWGAAGWLTGVAGAAPALAILLCLPFFPFFVARIGTVPAMSLGCILVGTGFLLMPVFQSPEAWLILRFVMGAGLALPWLVGETWINTVTSDHSRGRMLALYAVALFAGFAAGPSLLEIVGVDGRAPFLIGAGGIFLAVIPIVAAMRLAPKMPSHPQTGVMGALFLAPVAMIAGLIGGFIELGNAAMLPVYAVAAGATEAQALRLLTIFMLGGLLLIFLIGWLADRFSARSMLIVCGVLFATIISLVPFSEGLLTKGALIFVMGGIGVGFYTLGLTSIGQSVHVGDLAVANAAFLMIYQLGAMAGPSMAGAAMDLWQPHGFIAIMFAAAVLGAGAVMIAGQGQKACKSPSVHTV